ncbi:hypothetical protein [Selenomonas ruminantium]|nr:hypothetical protein [Selenomonas ruminantium]
MKRKESNIARIIEVRLNSLQMLYISDALGKIAGNWLLSQSWYRLEQDYREELTAGRSVVLTFPAELGALPTDYTGKKPTVPAEWLPVIIRALQECKHYKLAELLTALYEAIAWGYGAELYEFDGIFDLATIGGRERLMARQTVMEKMHGACYIGEA